MPTYQYACTVCGHQLEAVQSFSDAPLTECPECQGRLRKVFSAVGVVFKGSGFYRTDSRDSSSSSTAAKNGSAKDGSAKDAAKSDAKTETKSESKNDSTSTAKPAASASTSSS